MDDIDELIGDLKKKRDELRVQVNLASKDIRDEWNELEKKMQKFSNDAQLRDTGKGVGKALGALGQELKLGYERIRKALRDN
jgi:hypothetical protein